MNNDHLGSDIIDDNPSDNINDDDSSFDNAVCNFDISSPDINTFDNNASSVGDIDDCDTDSSDPDDYVFDISVVDSTERSNVFSDSEDVGDSDCIDIIDNGIYGTNIYSNSIKGDNEIGDIDSIYSRLLYTSPSPRDRG